MAPGQEDSDNGFFPKDFYSVAGSTYAYLLGSHGPSKCVDSTSLYTDRYDNGILCNAPLRSFKIYTRGLTEASAKMLKVQVWWNNRGLSGQIGSANSEQFVGFHRIGDPGRTVKQGYSFPIMSGLDQSYRISLFDPSDGSTDNLPLDWVIEVSIEPDGMLTTHKIYMYDRTQIIFLILLLHFHIMSHHIVLWPCNWQPIWDRWSSLCQHSWEELWYGW